MAKRRPSGDGMVRKRADGRWEGRIVIGHKDNGDSIFRYCSAVTQKELLRKLHQDIGRVARPLAGGICRPLGTALHPGRIPGSYPSEHQAPPG